MRLVSTRTLKLQHFFNKPPALCDLVAYMGRSEVSLQEFKSPRARNRKAGLSKILAACRLARQQDLDWVWVDTCCIDKTSSAELGKRLIPCSGGIRTRQFATAFLEDVASPNVRRDAEEPRYVGFEQSMVLHEVGPSRSFLRQPT